MCSSTYREMKMQSLKSLLLPGIFVNVDGTVELWKVTKCEEISMAAYIMSLAKALKQPTKQGKNMAKQFVGKRKSGEEKSLKDVLKMVFHGRFKSAAGYIARD